MAVAATNVGSSATEADRAYAYIREQLVMLEIEPGSPIHDEQLAREIGTGRTPVREALKRLERDRLVVAYPRRGTFATQVDITDLADISEIRLNLEPLAASRAAKVASSALRTELSALADEVEAAVAAEPTDRHALLRLDVRVHQAVYRAAGNAHLEDILVCQGAHATRIWCLFRDRIPHVAEHVQEHAELLRAIASGDAEHAASLARRHVEEFESVVRDLL